MLAKKRDIESCGFCGKELKKNGYDLVGAYLIQFSSCTQFSETGSTCVIEYDYLACKDCWRKHVLPVIKHFEKIEKKQR